MTTETAIPAGYWQSANGNLVPVSRVAAIDKDRSKLVEGLVEQAKKHSAALAEFKRNSMDAVDAFVERSAADYEVKIGGKKGNVSLVHFSGRYKVVRQMQESITFDERLQAAKALIDECILAWGKGGNANLRTLINDAFQVDQQGKISTGRVLGLRRHNITDATWQRAMAAIADSIQSVGSKPYIRFYERNDAGEYVAISLDVAAV